MQVESTLLGLFCRVFLFFFGGGGSFDSLLLTLWFLMGIREQGPLYIYMYIYIYIYPLRENRVPRSLIPY